MPIILKQPPKGTTNNLKEIQLWNRLHDLINSTSKKKELKHFFPEYITTNKLYKYKYYEKL